MEKMMLRKPFTTLIFCGLMLTANAPVHAIIIELLPALQEVETNTPVNIDLAISDLGDATAPSLGSFDLDITYDPTILALSGTNGLSFGDQLDLFGLGSLQSFDDSTPGTINLYEISLDLPGDLNSLQQSSFTLATLTFDTLLEGTTSLGVAVNVLGDAYGEPISAETNAAAVSVFNVDVPETTSLLLLMTGLVGLGWMRFTSQG